MESDILQAATNVAPSITSLIRHLASGDVQAVHQDTDAIKREVLVWATNLVQDMLRSQAEAHLKALQEANKAG